MDSSFVVRKVILHPFLPLNRKYLMLLSYHWAGGRAGWTPKFVNAIIRERDNVGF